VNVGKQIETIAKASGEKPKVEAALGVVEALRDDLDKGFLEDLSGRVEAEVAADYMEQAEELLGEGQLANTITFQPPFLPALYLRKLCERYAISNGRKCQQLLRKAIRNTQPAN